MSSISSVSSSSSSSFASTSLASKNNTNFEDFDLTQLEDITLDDFFLYHDKSLTFDEKKLKEIVNLKSTDLFHYIWMGNPLPEKYQENILKLKSLYPDKKFILWVDEFSSKNEDILKFVKDNNICLILLSDVFKEKYNFDLDEILQIEKNRLPSNWGAISDIYRYLIMYYFAGTYLDTDRKPDTVPIFKYKMDLEKLQKDISITYSSNDIIIVKKRKTQFFKDIFSTIKQNYEHVYYYYNFNSLKNHGHLPKSFRFNSTIHRTGPDLFSPGLSVFSIGSRISLSDFNTIEIRDRKSDLGWKGTLTSKVIDELIKERSDIESDIALNIIQELKERGILNLIRYDAIIDKLSFEARKRILDNVNIKEFLNKNPNFEIQHLIAKNEEEYEKFINLIPNKNKKIEFPYLAIKKAIKTKNIEMLNFLAKFLNNEDTDANHKSILIARAFLYNKDVLNNFIEAIAKNKVSINLHKIIYFILQISTDDQIKKITTNDLETLFENLKNKNLLEKDFNINNLIKKLVKDNLEFSMQTKISQNESLFTWIYDKLDHKPKENLSELIKFGHF